MTKTLNPSIASALASPLGVDSLSQLVFEGDTVVVVPDPHLAGTPRLMKEISVALQNHGALSCSITFLLDEENDEGGTFEKTYGEQDLNHLVHRPGRQEKLALLGVSEAGEPIPLCRELVDADVVITVERFFEKRTKDYYGIHSAIFPRFSDMASRKRYAMPEKTSENKKRKAEVAEVARMLGVLFTIQIFGDKVVAGLTENVLEELKK